MHDVFDVDYGHKSATLEFHLHMVTQIESCSSPNPPGFMTDLKRCIPRNPAVRAPDIHRFDLILAQENRIRFEWHDLAQELDV